MMNKIFKRLSFLFFVFTAMTLSGQDIFVTAGFDTSRIFIGDQINFSVTVQQPSGVPLSLPFFKDTLMKNIEILSGPTFDTAAVSEKTIKITGKYLVTSFDSGFYKVNPVFVEVRNNEGVKRFYSDYSVLEVARVKMTPPDTVTRIFDIIEPYKAPLTLGEILPWLLLGALAVFISFMIIRTNKHLFIWLKQIQINNNQE